MKKFDFEFLLIIIVVIITSVLAVNRSNSSNLSLNNRLDKEKTSGQTPEARGHEPWYLDGYVLNFILLFIFFLMSIT
jgi:hypothetical protein